jgi:hypothetical protein
VRSGMVSATVDGAEPVFVDVDPSDEHAVTASSPISVSGRSGCRMMPLVWTVAVLSKSPFHNADRQRARGPGRWISVRAITGHGTAMVSEYGPYRGAR